MADQAPSLGHKHPATAQYPEPLITQPLSGRHKQTFILLHGRGSNAAEFGPGLLYTPIPEFGTLRITFPDAKFIFPTASKRRARIYKRIPVNQWFDNWSLEAPEKWEESQHDGLRETSEYIHRLVRGEVGLVGAQSVVLGGLSQGCAASLVALLLWEGEPLAAGVGMCGWLPYRKRMESIVNEEDSRLTGEAEDQGDDIFERDSSNQDEESGKARELEGQEDPEANDAAAKASATTSTSITKAVGFLRDEIEVTASLPLSLTLQDIPLFLGHGTEDEKVPLDLGRSAANCLGAMNVDIHWAEYPGLGHWYSGDMLRDMIVFLRANTDWKVLEDEKTKKT